MECKLVLIAVPLLGLLNACREATLKVEREGNGNVTGSVEGKEVIDCSNRCRHQERKGFTVTLRAVPFKDEQLVEWRGDARSCGAKSPCTLTVPSRESYTASAVFSSIHARDDEEFAGPCYESL